MGLRVYQCKRCGGEWASKQERPVRCGKCKSPYWDRPNRPRAILGEGRKRGEIAVDLVKGEDVAPIETQGPRGRNKGSEETTVIKRLISRKDMEELYKKRMGKRHHTYFDLTDLAEKEGLEMEK